MPAATPENLLNRLQRLSCSVYIVLYRLCCVWTAFTRSKRLRGMQNALGYWHS